MPRPINRVPAKANGLCERGLRPQACFEVNRRLRRLLDRDGARIQAEFPRRGEMERCTRRSDDGASRASGCLPAAPPAPEGENRAEARTHLETFLELLGKEKGWVEKKAGERIGVKPPVLGTMSGNARPLFWGCFGENSRCSELLPQIWIGVIK